MTLFPDDGYSAAVRKSRKPIGWLLLAVFGLGLLAIWILPTPYVIEQPGPTYNVLSTDQDKPIISVVDAKTFPTSGNLDLLTVQIVGNRQQTPSWYQIVAAWMDPAKNVLPIEQVFPPNQSVQESKAESSAMMEMSQQDAIAVALGKLGYNVPVNLYISEVTKDSPASKKLIAADFVKSVSGVAVKTVEQLRAEINKYDGTTPLKIMVDRSGKLLTYDLTPIKDTDGKWRVGILVGYKYDFPVDVELKLADVGGPSGGMMFALGIYDKLTPGELTGGQYIAGTGTIAPNGEVGAIGGIRQKMYGAWDTGAKYFLAPKSNCDEVVGHIPGSLKVFSVSNFDQALNAVTAIGQKADLSKLPTCTK